MWNSRMRLALAAIALTAVQGAYAATDSANITVNASIAALCKLTLSTNTLDFSALDLTATGPASSNTITASYQCTKGSAVTATGFTVGGSSNGSYAGTLTSGTTTDTIPFSIGWTQPTALTGDGFGPTAAKRTATLSGSIANADYVTKTPASYTATVQVVVNY